jgi:hypothetical protein
MGFGRLIRVGNRRDDPNGVVYVVAEADPLKAMEIIKVKVTGSEVDLEDLGRVTDNLLKVLGLEPGQFTAT